MIGYLHIRTTKRLLADFGFSVPAQQMAGQAAVWPDAVRYFDDRYHAQTSLQPDGRPQPTEVAALNFSQLLSELVQKIRSGKPAERVAWLGVCLHLVQDLAVHQGNTGPEHFWQLFWLWKFPDIAPADVRRARDVSRAFLTAIRTKYGATVWNELKCSPLPEISVSQLRSRLMGKSDFSWREVMRSFRCIWQYQWWPKPLKHTRWDIDAVLARALK